MKRASGNIRGMTLVEAVITASILGLVASAFVVMFTKNMNFFRHMRARQQVAAQSRMCLERIEQAMRLGRASTLVISTPNVTPVVPNSRADFVLEKPLASGATAYAIFLENSNVYTEEFNPANNPTPVKIAEHVTGLIFTGDALDPGRVSVSLQIESPLETSKTPPQLATILMPNKLMSMTEGK
jgi:type II secretory pathway pseudopilin PulG